MQHENQSVLIVDDEKDIRDLLRFAMVADGYEVITAKDGVEALESIHHSQPDAVLLDLMMPTMSGYDVIEVLREEGTLIEVPVVILTASHLSEAERARLEGTSAIYQKGVVDVFDLVQTVKDAVA